MTNWYVEINQNSDNHYKSDKYLKTVIDTVSPFMEHFCKRLGEIEDWKLEDANRLFKEIIDELPIMQADIFNDEFSIRYNRWTYIKLTDSVKQIYRDSKLNKILA